MVTVSFEFFPPQTDQGQQTLASCASALAEFKPRFVSVTYGAGGTSQSRTIDALERLRASLDVPVAGHLTTVSASTDAVDEVIDTYRNLGVDHIVALRGDPPAEGQNPAEGGPVQSGYASAAELVAAIRSRPDGARFDISVAAYPEVHPKATSPQADLDNLKQKLDAGADRAITQFFFDPDVFLRFIDNARQAGIEAPIVPGIMPVTNFAGLKRFADRCGATIPGWMSSLLADLDDDPEIQQPVAATVAAEQCRRLAEEGVDEFHFYTMNRRQLTSATCRTLGLGQNQLDTADANDGGGAEQANTNGTGRTPAGSAIR